ncbi:uncharacterized protein M6B38_104465 [Iris pallida]|uniref:Uncharacterized protein n=1 Tax=Iris pallida TaxID=29817 RepID=A0AAX6F3M0_IRIPA|nr:uncharacterized protein M6B38_104465 [Iris pallida]
MHLQHDERDSTGHGGRSSGCRATNRSLEMESSIQRSNLVIGPEGKRSCCNLVLMTAVSGGMMTFSQLEAEAPPAKKKANI